MMLGWLHRLLRTRTGCPCCFQQTLREASPGHPIPVSSQFGWPVFGAQNTSPSKGRYMESSERLDTCLGPLGSPWTPARPTIFVCALVPVVVVTVAVARRALEKPLKLRLLPLVVLEED